MQEIQKSFFPRYESSKVEQVNGVCCISPAELSGNEVTVQTFDSFFPFSKFR